MLLSPATFSVRPTNATCARPATVSARPHLISPTLIAMRKCWPVPQSAKYHLGVDKDGQKRFVERATELAQGAGWAALSVGEEVADGSHLVFRYTGAPPAAPATPAPAGSGGGGGAEGAAAAAAEAAGEGAGLLVAAAERSAKAPEDAEVAAAEAAASSAAAAGELAAEAAAP